MGGSYEGLISVGTKEFMLSVGCSSVKVFEKGFQNPEKI